MGEIRPTDGTITDTQGLIGMKSAGIGGKGDVTVRSTPRSVAVGILVTICDWVAAMLVESSIFSR